MFGNRTKIDPRLLHVDNSDHEQWARGNERTLVAGVTVLCAAGMARIARVCGKTGDGSRLLELTLLEGDSKPFYAAASNVLVAP